MKTYFTYRLLYFYAFLSTLGLFALAFYLQFWKGISPCPLCVLQRLALAALSFCFLLGFLLKLKRSGRIIVGLLALFFSITGILLAGRQVWIQHLPPGQTPDCGVSLDYMLHVLPLSEVAQKVLEGSAECSLVEWTFIGLGLADWTFLCFVIYACFTLRQILKGPV